MPLVNFIISPTDDVIREPGSNSPRRGKRAGGIEIEEEGRRERKDGGERGQRERGGREGGENEREINGRANKRLGWETEERSEGRLEEGKKRRNAGERTRKEREGVAGWTRDAREVGG